MKEAFFETKVMQECLALSEAQIRQIVISEGEVIKKANRHLMASLVIGCENYPSHFAPFDTGQYLGTAHLTHYILRLSAERDERPFRPITEKSLKDFVGILKAQYALQGAEGLLSYLETEVDRLAPDFINKVTLNPIITPDVLFGIADVLIPSFLAAEV